MYLTISLLHFQDSPQGQAFSCDSMGVGLASSSHFGGFLQFFFILGMPRFL